MAGAVAAPPDVDQPLRTGARAASDAAVVVGIEDYAFVADVPHARRDASAFADFLLYTRGVPQENLQRLDGASREQVLKALERASGEVGKGGTLWVYWAGHGAASPSDGSRMLLGVDTMADEAVFEARAIRVDELQRAVERSGAAQSVVVLDTCYSGVGRGGGDLLAGKRFAVPAYATEPSRNVTLWTAAEADQLSAAWDPARHGLFTYFAIGALRGWADGELDGAADGAVTLREAQSYVTRALRTVGKRAQTPTVDGEHGLDWVLARGKLESGPELATLADTGAVGAGGPGGTDAGDFEGRLDALRASQEDRAKAEAEAERARQKAVDEAVAPLRKEARELWARVEEVAVAGGPEAELALREFIERYETAAVTVDGQAHSVVIPEVDKARTRLRMVAGQEADPAARVRRKVAKAGLYTGLGSVVALSGAAVSRALYVRAGAGAGQLDGVYYTNQGLGYAGYTGLVVSVGMLGVAGSLR